MTEELKETIRVMIARAKPTPEEFESLIQEWNGYFNRFGIADTWAEFNAIMRIRAHSGVISVLAPKFRLRSDCFGIPETILSSEDAEFREKGE